MKKLIQTLVVLILFSTTNVFSGNPISKNSVSDSLSNINRSKGILEMGIGIKEGELAKLKVNFIKSFPINSKLSWGLGTGLHLYGSYFLIPFFANFRANFYDRKKTPYFSFNTGYLGNHDYPGFLLNPTFGFSFRKSKLMAFDIGIGYDMWFHGDVYFSPLNDLKDAIVDAGVININLGISL